MFADERYQAPTAPMEFMPATETHLDPAIVAQNQHDAQLRPITVLQKPVRYSGIPEVTVVPSDQVWGLFDQTLSYVKMNDTQCHCNVNRHDLSKRWLPSRFPRRTCYMDLRTSRDGITLSRPIGKLFARRSQMSGDHWELDSPD